MTILVSAVIFTIGSSFFFLSFFSYHSFFLFFVVWREPQNFPSSSFLVFVLSFCSCSFFFESETIGSIGMALAWEFYSLLFFRFVTGIGVGIGLVLAPLYVAEVSFFSFLSLFSSLFLFLFLFSLFFPSLFFSFLVPLSSLCFFVEKKNRNDRK